MAGKTTCTVIIIALSLAACGYSGKNPRTRNIALFQCGDALVETEYREDNTMMLDVEGRISHLSAVLAASGAKYETPAGVRPRIVFWNKGGEATLTIGKRVYPLCKELRNTDRNRLGG